MKSAISINRIILSVILILFSLAVLRLIAFQPGKEFQVNTHTIGDQRHPCVGMDAKGNFVITWQSENQDGSREGIFAQRFNKKGKTLGKEFQVNTETYLYQWSPAIAMDTNGNFVITWESRDQYPWHRILAQRFNKQGKPLGKEFQVNTYNSYDQRSPAIAMDPNGNFVITWSSYLSDNSATGISAQRFNKKGKALGKEFQVNTYWIDWQGRPSIAIAKNGNFVITWQSNEQDDSGKEIYAQRYKRYGKAIGPEFRVNTYTQFDQEIPKIAMDEKGNFVIVWQCYGQDTQWYKGIFAQRFNKNGKALGKEFQVNTYTELNQEDPVIAMDRRGNFVIVWNSDEQDGSDWGIYAQRYDRNGKAIGSEFRVNTHTKNMQLFPTVVMDKMGNFVVAWDSLKQDGSAMGIFAKMFKK